MSLQFRRRREPQFDWEDPRPFTGASEPGQPDTAPLDRLRALGPRPDTFPALDERDTGPMQRMPRLTRVQQRPRPDRPYDAFIPVWSKILGQHLMECGVCVRSRYADPTTAHMPFPFEALRESAYAAGWRLDRFARWACPACQRTPAYHARYSLIHWDPDAAEAYGTSGEREYRQAAEHDLIRDVHDAARRYRHAPKADAS